MTSERRDLVKHWKPILRALDPFREVGLDEIETLYAERQAAPYKELATELALADHPSTLKVILCGSRGSGKSTELTRLAREVSNDFCVVHTDLAAGLPDQAGTLAVVTLLGVAALHAIRTWSDEDDADAEREVAAGARLQDALKKFGGSIPTVSQLMEGISGIVTVFNPAVGAALATTTAVVKATGATTTAAAKIRHELARGPLEGRLPAERRDDAKAVVDAVNGILSELATLSGRPPLLLAEGLDKRTGVEEVQLALSEEYLLRELQAPMVLTGPVNLRHDPRFRAVPGNFRLALLYNVAVRERAADGTALPATGGIHMLRDLYERRRAAAGIPESLFSDASIERAALQCSGIIREFLELLSSACKNALLENRRETTPHDLAAAAKARRLVMQGYLDEHAVGILRRVLDKGILPAAEEADTLLFENFIACYPNGDIWFRPHELIVDFIAAQQGSE